MNKFSVRTKLILSGLFLSRFDKEGLSILGFSNFAEAFNVIALSLNAKPASLKNYRDEFDPYFSNPRKGWHKRPIRPYCKAVMDRYGRLGIEDFSNLIKSEISVAGDLALIDEQIHLDDFGTFAKRLVTGQAAERYFEMVYKAIPCFSDCELTNTTIFGCGFDYRMQTKTDSYLAVEVKGISASSGTVQLTAKEYRIAKLLGDRYFLFVVQNFIEKPFHTIYPDPINSDLIFERRETTDVQISWSTSIKALRHEQ